MERHFLYMIKCADESLYTGYTTDPERRLLEHNSGRGARYTRTRLPVTLVYLEERGTRADALKRESQIKRMSRNTKLSLCEGFQSSKVP